jgi:hypothetical protein
LHDLFMRHVLSFDHLHCHLPPRLDLDHLTHHREVTLPQRLTLRLWRNEGTGERGNGGEEAGWKDGKKGWGGRRGGWGMRGFKRGRVESGVGRRARAGGRGGGYVWSGMQRGEDSLR